MDDLPNLTNLYGEELHIRKRTEWLKSSARVQEIEKRSELDSSNGYIIDKHDQFYRDHKLLLTLFRVSYNFSLK